MSLETASNQHSGDAKVEHLAFLGELLAHSAFLNLSLPEARQYSRVCRAIEKRQPFAIVSACQSEQDFDTPVTLADAAKMLDEIKGLGLGAIQLRGRYLQNGKPISAFQVAFLLNFSDGCLQPLEESVKRLLEVDSQRIVFLFAGDVHRGLRGTGSSFELIESGQLDLAAIEKAWARLCGGSDFKFTESGICSSNWSTTLAWKTNRLVSDLVNIPLKDFYNKFGDTAIVREWNKSH